MHSLTINKITHIENLNYPGDHYIYFDGGHVIFSPTNGPLRFWYENRLVILVVHDDVWELNAKLIAMRNPEVSFTWERNYGHLLG